MIVNLVQLESLRAANALPMPLVTFQGLPLRVIVTEEIIDGGWSEYRSYQNRYEWNEEAPAGYRLVVSTHGKPALPEGELLTFGVFNQGFHEPLTLKANGF